MRLDTTTMAAKAGGGLAATSGDAGSRDAGGAFGDVLGDLAQSKATVPAAPAAEAVPAAVAAPTAKAFTNASRAFTKPEMPAPSSLVRHAATTSAPGRGATTQRLLELASRASDREARASSSDEKPSSMPSPEDGLPEATGEASSASSAEIDARAAESDAPHPRARGGDARGSDPAAVGARSDSASGAPAAASSGERRSRTTLRANAAGDADTSAILAGLPPGFVPPSSAGRPDPGQNAAASETDTAAASTGAVSASRVTRTDAASDQVTRPAPTRSDVAGAAFPAAPSSALAEQTLVGGTPVATAVDAAIVPGSVRFEAHLGFSRNAASVEKPRPTSTSNDETSLVSTTAGDFEGLSAVEPKQDSGAPLAATVVSNGGSADAPPTSAGTAATPTAAIAPLLAGAGGLLPLAPASRNASPATQQVAAGIASLAQSAAEPAPARSIGPARTMILQLSPAGLGTVSVRLHVSGSALDVRLETSERRTADMIDHDRADLAAALHDESYQLHSLSVTTSDTSPSGANHAEPGTDLRSNDDRSFGQSQSNRSSDGETARRDPGGEQRRDRSSQPAPDDPRDLRNDASLFV